MAKTKVATNPYSPKGRVKRKKHSKTHNKRDNSKPYNKQGRG